MVLYVGTNGKNVRAAVTDLPVRDEGPLPGDEVSRRLRAMDLYLTPFVDGVSTRRGSMMAGLQHGLPIVGTAGELTDNLLRAESDRSLLLADVDDEAGFVERVVRLSGDAELRQRTGRAARALFEREFTWERIAKRLTDVLASASVAPTTAAAAAAATTASGLEYAGA
jgi:glycosyltransferase involved in cell wall biosynthesis